MAFHKAKALQEAEKSVSQGKISQAIKQYQEILDNDPSDVSLLNTVGDLYIRDRNITEGLRQFHKLAEAYVREGFNVKAIAIYRKITKIDPNTVDTLLKLAELYQLQGLSREARELYLQATEFFKKRNQTERALETLRKLVQLDPENINFRNRLATECEQAGKREDAAQAHLESAEILLRREDLLAAETALKKAADLNPKNLKIQIQRARVAIVRQQPEEAERIINASPELQSDPAGKRILLDSYLATRKLPEAENLVLEVFHSNPANFAPVASVSALLVEKGDIDEAYRLLSSVADPVISQNNAGPLLEALRRIWSAAPKHIPTLELIHRLCERTADELTLPEVLEALGRVHEEAGNMAKAEEAYLKLSEREPENENYRGLLNAVQRKLGREIKPVDFATKEMVLAVAAEEEIPPEPAGIDANQELMLKEALENSDLFSRYNLTEKAIAELEKVLQVYPDQVEVHRRILEIARKGFPERAAAAAAQLARISTEHGDGETAGAYHAIASAKETLHEIPLPPPPPGKKVEEPAAPPPAPPEKPETEKTAEFPIPLIAPEEPLAAPAAPSPEEVPFDLTPPEAPSEPAVAPPPSPIPTEQATELDLSGDLEAMAGFGFEAPAPSVPELIVPPPVEITAPAETPAPSEEAAPVPVEIPAPPEAPAPPPVVEEATPPVEAPTEVPEPPPGLAEEEETIPVDLEDSLIEIEFYLENGFIDEARKAVAVLEEKYPESPLAAALRQRLDERVAEAPPAEPPVQIVSEDEAVVVEPPAEFVPADEAPPAEPAIEVVQAEPEVASPPELVPVAEEPAPVAASPEPAPVAEKPVPVAASPEPAPVAEEPAHEEWELPTSYAVTPEPEPAMDAAVPPPVVEPEAPPPVAELATPPPAHQPVVEEPVAAESGGADMLGDLAGDLATSLDELAAPEDAPPAPPASVPFIAAPPPAASPQGAAQLDGLLAEMEDPGAAAAAKGDPETHYNLGVAFREMALLDEAIGEFQKVVKGSGKGNFPTNFLQACSLLAICFMEKKMPAIAVKWYLRAMETPGLDEEAQMALQYDLGLAYEQAGDSRKALESFTEVYSQNIDFRDVAEKIREHQQKA
jgi:tetratricopeptide (TPR) repeat protein